MASRRDSALHSARSPSPLAMALSAAAWGSPDAGLRPALVRGRWAASVLRQQAISENVSKRTAERNFTFPVEFTAVRRSCLWFFMSLLRGLPLLQTVVRVRSIVMKISVSYNNINSTKDFHFRALRNSRRQATPPSADLLSKASLLGRLK